MLFAENTNVFATVIVAIITFGLCALVANVDEKTGTSTCTVCGAGSNKKKK